MSGSNFTIVLITLCITGIGGPSRLAYAQDPPITTTSQIQTSGMVGITAGQNARLNALNPGLPAPFATAARCSAQLSFVDEQGIVLKTASVTVDPGKSLGLDLNRDKDIASSAGRVEIRAVVSTPPVVPPTAAAPPIVQPLPFCTLIPTLEIIDNDTLKTHVVLTEVRFVSLPLPLADGSQNPAGH